MSGLVSSVCCLFLLPIRFEASLIMHENTARSWRLSPGLCCALEPALALACLLLRNFRAYGRIKHSIFFIERFVLIFWRDENAVTAVPAAKVVDPEYPEVGNMCTVRMARKVYSGEVVGIGKYMYVSLLTMYMSHVATNICMNTVPYMDMYRYMCTCMIVHCVSFPGTQDEMKQLAQQYENGEWSPPTDGPPATSAVPILTDSCNILPLHSVSPPPPSGNKGVFSHFFQAYTCTVHLHSCEYMFIFIYSRSEQEATKDQPWQRKYRSTSCKKVQSSRYTCTCTVLLTLTHGGRKQLYMLQNITLNYFVY